MFTWMPPIWFTNFMASVYMLFFKMYSTFGKVHNFTHGNSKNHSMFYNLLDMTR